ncbi:MAG TPA: type II secretion system protein N [Gammaproteobacteria bacterium]|nr:type II secretion system protein N [Gammaproteobacteria bacterium]
MLTAIGLVALLVFLIALLPARLVVGYTTHDIKGLTIGSVTGSVWDAQLRQVNYRGITAPNVTWNLDFWPLLLGTVSAKVDAELAEGFARFEIDAGLSGETIQLSNVQAAMTLDTLATFYPAIPAGTADGDLMVNLASARFENGKPVYLEGRAGLSKLTSTWTGTRPLGSYEADISTENDVMQAIITDIDGPVKLIAKATLKPQGNWQVSGDIAARDSSDKTLQQAMQFLGPADARGMHQFSFSGQL